MHAATEATQLPVSAEDQARANFYALLGCLYATAPDPALLATLAAADELSVVATDAAARDLARSWQLLTAASGAMNPAAIGEEFQDLFVGVGQSAVSLHASGYVKSTGGSVLADLRTTLARLGLGRKEGVSLYEDHLATICETMRVLVGGAPGIEARTVAQQREFFAAYVLPWAGLCCNAIKISPIANYYRRVAEFTDCFVAIERDSFAIE